jgi:acetyl-CoA carboxylase carboxyl transferase subunit alpha
MATDPSVTSPLASSGMNGFLEFEKPLFRIQQGIDDLEREQEVAGRDLVDEIRRHRSQFRATLKRIYENLTPWEVVLVARHPKRPLVPDYLQLAFRDFCELHGDRTYGDDRAIITGFARIGGHRVLVVGHNKGKDVKERLACNFGCAHPEGYRKALQKMRLAEKYGLPVVCLIDTQGAYPGIGSEERGISQAIAMNLREMSRLRTPIVCAVIGEGGSGGALGVGVGDRVAMLQHAFYSVISPEGCAAILWKSAERRKHAAEALRLTAPELLRLGLVDEVIVEPLGGAHRDPEAAAGNLEKFVVQTLDDLSRMTTETLIRRRNEKLAHLGTFFESRSEGCRNGRPMTAEVSHSRRSTSRTRRIANRAVAVPVGAS